MPNVNGCTVLYIILAVILVFVFYAASFSLASGDGDTIMRFCPSFQIVELMRQGKSPQDACKYVVRRILDNCGASTEVAVIALDMKVF